jgi:hypothetical protein
MREILLNSFLAVIAALGVWYLFGGHKATNVDTVSNIVAVVLVLGVFPAYKAWKAKKKVSSKRADKL